MAFAVVLLFALPGSIALAQEDAVGAGQRTGVMDAAPPGGLLEAVLFYAVAAVTIIASLGICIGKNIVRMAVWLFIALGSVAMLYFLLAANFLAAVQLIVYAGGTLILLVFGVMLTSKSPWARFEPAKRELLAAAVVCGVLLVSLCMVLFRAIWPVTEGFVPGAAVADLGRALLTTYLVPFEVAGVLLMIVMVGAAHLARQDK
jgi:NADH-quinone oxidoreductase subunit J